MCYLVNCAVRKKQAVNLGTKHHLKVNSKELNMDPQLLLPCLIAVSGLRFVIVVFPDHTHLLFLTVWKISLRMNFMVITHHILIHQVYAERITNHH